MESSQAAAAYCWLLWTFKLRKACVVFLPGASTKAGSTVCIWLEMWGSRKDLGTAAISALLGSVIFDSLVQTVMQKSGLN